MDPVAPRPPRPEPPALQERHLIYESLGITVWDFRCRVHVHDDGPEEYNQAPSIAFIRRGVFRRQQDEASVVADANQALSFNPGRPYRIAHPLPGGDDCTVVALTVPAALELVESRGGRPAERPEAPFRAGHAISSPRAARLHVELLR